MNAWLEPCFINEANWRVTSMTESCRFVGVINVSFAYQLWTTMPFCCLVAHQQHYPRTQAKEERSIILMTGTWILGQFQTRGWLDLEGSGTVSPSCEINKWFLSVFHHWFSENHRKHVDKSIWTCTSCMWKMWGSTPSWPAIIRSAHPTSLLPHH